MATTAATSRRAGEEATSHVICDPQIQGGEPTIRGTRTTVRSVVLSAREWGDVAGVLRDFPHLSGDAVADALAYAQHHRDEIEGLIRADGDSGEE